MIVTHTHTERERGAETQAEGEAGSLHWDPDVGFDPGSPGSRPGPKAGAKPLRHPGIPGSHVNYGVGLMSSSSHTWNNHIPTLLHLLHLPIGGVPCHRVGYSPESLLYQCVTTAKLLLFFPIL